MATSSEATPTDTLSTRMAATVKAFLNVANAVAARANVGEGNINLADGENSFMKAEMVEICKNAMSKSINPDVR